MTHIHYDGPHDLFNYSSQIEDLSQQAQMAAAEKFKTSEPSFADKTTKPSTEIPALEEEESDDEVIHP